METRNSIGAASVNENGVEIIEDDISTNETAPDILPGFKTMDNFLQKGFQAAMEATKLANRLPSGHRWDIYTSYSSFQRLMEGEANQMMQILSMILKHQGIGANVLRRDVEEKFDLVVEANDTILERVGFNLDDLAGIRRNPEPVLMEAAITRPVTAPWNTTDANQTSSPRSAAVIGSGQTLRLLTARNIERPQAKFKDKIDNSPNPFEPIIKYKPNAITPLAITLEVTDEGEGFCHPYEYELERLKVPPSQLRRVPSPQAPLPLQETPLVVVERPEDIHIMLEDLRRYTEVAIDLEHHAYRTYQGLTCLMQLSTRDTDYIVDTLTLRSGLQCLNDIFTDSRIVKVLHGADSDVEWLQRDLGLYLVNMFDTHQAARVLGLAHLSLAFLLKHYCHVTANKQYQLADWRIRPLPEELVNYAREDTHYLLYIYDLMKNELLEKANGKDNLLLSVIQRSTEICKKRYEKPVVTEHSHTELYQRHKKLFDNRQVYALRELFRWRDKMARQEDESIGYVLPNHMLLQISEVLPREMQGILACCNPIPPLVRQHLSSLHQIILKARDQSLIRPVVEEERHARPAAQTQFLKANLEGPLLCPHDLSHASDFRDDLPCLLRPVPGEEAPLLEEAHRPPLSAEASTITVFADAEAWADEEEEELPARVKQVRFVSPYARYLRVRPYTHQLEVEEAQKENGATVNRRSTMVAATPTKREISSEETDTVADISAGSPTLDSPADAKTSAMLDSSLERPPSLKREHSPEPDLVERRQKHQPMPDEILIASSNNDNLLTSAARRKMKKERKKKERKANAERAMATRDGESHLGNIDGDSEGEPKSMQPPETHRLSAGQKHPRDNDDDAVAENEMKPTPPKLRKVQARGLSQVIQQEESTEPEYLLTCKLKEKVQRNKQHQQQESERASPQPSNSRQKDPSYPAPADTRGPGRGQGPRARHRGRGGGGGVGGGGGHGSGVPGPSGTGRGGDSHDKAPFQPFDYSKVDFEGRFKGGSKRAGVAKDSVNWKKAKGKKGKTMFAGKMNQKSITFAKKLI